MPSPTTTPQPLQNSPASKPATSVQDPAPLPAQAKPAPEQPGAFEELDALANRVSTNHPEPAKDETPTAPPPEPQKTPAEPAKTPATVTSKQLRDAHEAAKKRVAELEEKLQEYESRLKDNPEVKSYKQQLEEQERRAKELDERLRFTNYERSQEYREKFEVPMEKAFRTAFEDVSQLVIEDAETGSTTQATPEHFKQLVTMPLQQAIKQAKTWFGEAAPEVLAHRRQILDLDRQRREAIEDFRKRGEEITSKQADEHRRTLERFNSEAIERFPEWFGKSEDPEDQQLFDSGLKMAQLAIDGDPNLPPERFARVLSEVRNRAAAFGRMVYRNKSLQAKVEALESELEQFRNSVPAPGGASTAAPAQTGESWETELEKLAGK